MDKAPPQKNPHRWFLSLYFPTWSTDVTKRKLASCIPPLTPSHIVLTKQHTQKILVARACMQALADGIHPDMDLALARARTTSSLYIEPFDPVRDKTALQTLATWCLRFSPLVGVDYELTRAPVGALANISPLFWGISIDLTGTNRIHKDLSRLAHTIHSLFKGSARVALAPTYSAAWGFSRFKTPALTTITSYEKLYTHAASLPIAALRVDTDIVTQLTTVGILRIGDLLRFPRHTLSKRFGKAILIALGQFTGEIEERVATITPQEQHKIVKQFEPPLPTSSRIIAAIISLHSSLCISLHEKHVHAKRFVIAITDTDDNTITKEFSLPMVETRTLQANTTHITSIISPIVERLSFSGEVGCIELSAHDIVPFIPQQTACTPDHIYDSSTLQANHATLINTFVVRLGKDSVARVSLKDTHMPEESFSYTSIVSKESEYCAESSVPYTPEERPSILLQNPEPITTIAMLPDKPPSWIKWRRQKLTITSGFGPSRITYPWWDDNIHKSPQCERDYFTIQDESGRWYWVYRDNKTHSWFLHGLWS